MNKINPASLNPKKIKPNDNINNNQQVNIKKTDILNLKIKKNNNDNEIKSSQLNNSDINYKEINEINNINPKIEKNKKKLNKKIKEEKEEIILINDDDKSEESNISVPYKKKIIQNKSIDKKGKKSKTKKNKEEKRNPSVAAVEIPKNKSIINNNINNNLSFSSNNNDKGNFNQVLFDYKNFVEKKGPTKRKKDLDEEELKDIKYQKDLIEKQKKRGWIQKEEIIKEKKNKKGNDNNKEIKLESYVNESIKENNENLNGKDKKDLNNSDISLLSLDKLNNKENKESINDNQMDIEENEKDKIDDNSMNTNSINDKNKEIEKSTEKVNNNSIDDLLLLDKITDFRHEKNINNIIDNSNGKNNSTNKKLSQEGLDLDFNSNVQSKDKSYNFNNNLVLKNSQEKNEKNILEEKNTKLSKFQEYLKFKKLNDNKNNDNNNIINPQNYELEIKTQEDQQTYDEFYKMNHNNKKSLLNNNKKRLSNNNNNFLENLPENSRIKKEREKMKGHKCELCQKFYDCLDENAADYLCQECSRHRTDQPINKTPKDFYDLNI